MSTPLKYGLLSVSLFYLSSACAEPLEDPMGLCDLESCSDACQKLEGDDCDVLTPSCQRRIFDAVSCVRGNGGKVPQIRAVTEDEYRAEQEGDAGVDAGADAGGDGGVEVDSGPMPLSSAETWEIALKLLRLRLPQTSTEYIDSLGGVYSSRDKRITLIDRGEPQDEPSAQRVLAHELVHALQDQNMGLRDFRRGVGASRDAALASGCLTEGEAELYHELAWALLRGLSVDESYWEAWLDQDLKYNRDAVLRAESPFDQTWLLRYPVGSRYMFDAWRAGGNWGVQSLYEAPPISTVYWMHGFAESQNRTEPLTTNLACSLAALPKGYTRGWSDTQGAFSLFAFLGHNLTQRGVYQTERSWQRALAWRQDHFEVFAGPSGETALSWRIRFAEAALAKEIAEDLNQSDLDVRVVRHDDEIELFASDSRSALKEWKPTDPKRCPKED